MCFDDLEGFVHESGGINRDLLPHFPRRMAQCLVHRSTGYALRGPGAKRSARRGENEPRQLAGTTPRDALQHGAVLRIDRHDLAAPLARRPGDQLARHHERLLVGERHALPGLECRQRRLEPRRPDYGVHHDLHVGMRGRLDQTRRPFPLSPFPFPAVHEPHVLRFPLGNLPLEQVHIRVRRQRRDPEPIPLARQDLERRAPDRSGGPEDRDADSHARPNSRSSPAATGATKYSESRRSSTPPCPGMSDEESLSPTSRLSSDSATSPTWAASATTNPTVTSCRTSSRKATRSSTSGP